MDDPIQLLASLLPSAKSEDELLMLAAQKGPPPGPEFKVGMKGAVPPGGIAKMQGMPNNPLLAGKSLPNLVPPMTPGESRTSIGQHLIPGGGY